MTTQAVRSRPAKVKLYGCETPRIFTPPLRELTPETSRGFECIEFAEVILGVKLLPWQKWLLIHALELLEDGSYRFRTVLLLVARQNGKSTVLKVLALWRMYCDAARLVLGTAQDLDTAEVLWSEAVEMARDVPELDQEIKKVTETNGKKALVLESGERYRVRAPNRKGGRSLTADLVMIDELREHANWEAWAAITKTTLARFFAQVWAASNAGDASSVVLRFLRKLAHVALGNPDGIDDLGETPPPELVEDDEDLEQDPDTLGIFEWSAAPGISIWDRQGWAQANPSMNHASYTISEKAIAADARTDPEPIFRTEVLCQWLDTTTDGPFPPGTWEAALDTESMISGQYVYCVDVSWDRTKSYIGVAGRRPDGTFHIEVVAQRAGTNWVPGWFEATPEGKDTPRKDDENLIGAVLQANGAPVSSLLADLKGIKGLNVIEWAGADLGRGTGKLYDSIRGVVDEEDAEKEVAGDPIVFHRGQPLLNTAAAFASTKPMGDTWVWDRAKSIVDIAPLVCVTGALWGFTRSESEPPKAEPRIRIIGG